MSKIDHADYIAGKKTEKTKRPVPAPITTAVQTEWPPKVTAFLGVGGKDKRHSTAKKILENIKSGNGGKFDVKKQEWLVEKDGWKKAIEEVRAIADKDARNDAKAKLWAIKFQGEFSKLGNDGLASFSGLAVVDLDHLENLAETKAKLFASPHIVAVFVSPSGDGLKVLIDCRGYNGQTYGIAEAKAIKIIEELTGIKADADAKGVSRFCYISYDPGLKQKWDTTPIEAPTAEEIKGLEDSKRPRKLADSKETDFSTNYGKKVLGYECEKASEAQDGTRHQTLNTSAFLIGTLVGGGEIAYEDAIDALEEAGTACGLPMDEVGRTVERAVLEGMQSPRNADSKDDVYDDVAVELSEASKEKKPVEKPRANPKPTALDLFLNATSDSAGVSKALVDAKTQAKADGRLQEYPEGFIIAPVKSKADPEPESVTWDSEAVKTPWREVKTDEIRNIVIPTALGPIVEALQAVTEPPLPLEVVLVKALCLAGCALSGPDLGKYNPAFPPTDKWAGGQGTALAKVKIATAGGQIPNVYGVLVCPSGTGKDIGQVLGNLARRNKWLIGTGGSKEGIQDAFKQKPNGLVIVSEMSKWLDKLSWQSKAKEFLTEAFNSGSFSEPRSERSKESRESPYIYPNVFASVQPDTITRLARTEDIDNGFLGRFLFSTYEERNLENPPIPTVEDMAEITDLADRALGLYQSVAGSFRVPKDYPRRLLKIFADGRAGFDSHYKRLACEYLPRIALMLSVKRENPKARETLTDEEREEFYSTFDLAAEAENLVAYPLAEEISQDALDKAERLVLWFYAQAEGVLGLIREDEKTAVRERSMKAIARHIQSHKGRATRATISKACYRQSPDGEARLRDTKELMERGVIVQDGKTYKVAKMPPGW